MTEHYAVLDPDASMRQHRAPIQPWLDEAGITEIAINRPGELWFEKDGRWESVSVPDFDAPRMRYFAQSVAAYREVQFDTKNPILSATLTAGERIQIVGPPVCEHLSITIRKPGMITRTLTDYKNDGYFEHIRPKANRLSEVDARLLKIKESDPWLFFKEAVKAAKTIVLAGGTGSGKTTFMRALVEEIPVSQRIITIQDVHELFLENHPNVVHLYYPSEARADDLVTSAVLLKSCLRMKPDRILLAELRGGETFDFINVAASGHGGTITSMHSDSPALAFERLILMAMQNPKSKALPYEVIRRLLHQTIDVVVHVDNDVHSPDHLGRHITEIYFEPEKKLQLMA
ncbi:P-type DNA transfer ATPase VirB11 [Dongshaea marina]|uniref:P-type DNA transfer ATPase VirB11 n=1 Tax=Dongshaea marina TaxID=2047966 RepID=UPI000D3E783F|nr:P-type DNA transfer ATPase VirB11 [Dongshaea marina]